MDNTDITIEGNTAIWRMPTMEGQINGTYNGTFIFRCWLDPVRQLQAGREYREFLGQNAGMATETEANLAFALSQIKQRVIKAPPFWTSTAQESGIAGNIGDFNIIAAVLDAAIRAEQIYKNKMQKERDLLLKKSIEKSEAILKAESEEAKEE